MGPVQPRKRINLIPRIKAMLVLLAGGVMVAGCSHQNLDSRKLSCSDVTQKFGSTSRDCPPVRIGPASSPGEPLETAALPDESSSPSHTVGKIDDFQTQTTLDNKGLILEAKTDLSRPLSEKTAYAAQREAETPATSYRDLAAIIRHTLRDNPDIGMAIARERDEFTSIEIARAAKRPTVNLRAATGPENFDTGSVSTTGVLRQEYSIDLHQNVYDFGRSQSDISRRKALHNSAGYRRIDKMNQVTLEVSKAFMSILETRQHLIIAGQNVSSHEEILELVTQSQKAGASSVADVKRVTTRLEKAKTNLIDLRSRKQNAREEFISLTGLRPDNLMPSPRLGASLPPKGLSSKNFPDNPALLAVRADIDSLRAQARTARANFNPSIDLDMTGNVKENVGGLNAQTAGFKGLLSLNYKLLDGDQRLNILRQILIRITENKHRYRKKRREYIRSLENAIRTVRANMKKSSLLASRTADSRKVLSLYKAQFRDGSKTVFELLDAQTDLFTTNSEKIANHYGEMRSIYEIYSLRGDLVTRLLK